MAKKKTTAKSQAPRSKRSTPARHKFIYFFGAGKAEGDRTMRDLLGGKGANLAEMTNASLPVPRGFTISTDACRAYFDQGRKVPAAIDQEMLAQLKRLEAASKASFGSSSNPLLVS